ncbi:MAG: tRNA threonylcarbamoyladenosine biosynthesis protein RimN [Gammaproteobacteria bacterium]|jgi:L-threonylcarbamoyladenylate synthase|nr:tRNA threonylcarbamoyladenosine biosynthesis protein RimN [Gammaproteobacteria bacterium]
MFQFAIATQVLIKGGIIAYPTEAVYGLGCDPLNETAVHRLLEFKHRSINKGLILIAADWAQLANYVAPLSHEILNRILPTWPGPVTWLLPASLHVPVWIKGAHDTIAVRVTDHPIAKELCKAFGSAIVSTSANVEASPPARTAEEVKQVFGGKEVYIVAGDTGGLAQPSRILDGVTGEIVRP